MDKEFSIKQSHSAGTLTKVSLYVSFVRRGAIIFYIIYCVFVLNAILSILLPETDRPGGGGPDIASFAIVFLFPVLIWFLISWKARQALAHKARYYTNITYTFTPSYFRHEGENFSNTHKWEELIKIKETKNWILVYTDKVRAVFIEKSQLDPWQKEAIDAILDSVKTKVKVVR